MPIFNNTLLTERGFEAANKAANGQGSFTIIKAVASQRDYRSKSDNELRQLTGLDGEIEGKILDQNNTDNKVTGIKTNYTNELAPKGYTVNTAGLYARDNNGNVFLYSVTTSNIGQVVPPQSDNIFSGFELTVYVMVGNVQNMKVELEPGGDATIEYVNRVVSTSENRINDILKTKVSFDGGKITTGNGTFVPASVEDFNNTNNKTLLFRKRWEGDIKDLVNELPGFYEISGGINNGGPDGFNGFGSALLYKTSSDSFIILADNGSRHWFGHQATYGWTGWSEVADRNAVDEALKTKVSFEGGKITTGNGTFVPAALETVNNQLATKANVDDVKDALSKKVSFDGGKITTAYGSFVPASVETLQGIIDKSFQYHGKWTAPLANMNNALSGIYQLDLSNTNAGQVLNGWDGYGAAVVYNNGVDCYVTIYGHNGLQWNNHTINGMFVAWQSLPTQSDVNSLQSQINANASDDVRYRGEWNNKGLWDLKNQPNGIYWVSYNDKDVIPGWNKVNSMVTKTSIPSGCLLRLTDSVGNEWITNNFTNNTFFTWVKLN